MTEETRSSTTTPDGQGARRVELVVRLENAV